MSDLMKLLYGDLEYPTSIEIRGHQPHVNICRDKLTYKFGAKRRYTEPGAVQSNICAPKDCVLYYFEVEFITSDTPANAVVGFSKPTYYHNRHPGSQPNSIGYHGESGNRSNGSGKSVTYGSSYGCGDVIGCGINYIDQCYFFTRNGKHQGNAGELHHCDNYPTVSLERPADTVKLNFVGPFKFDIEGEYRRIVGVEYEAIDKHHVDSLSVQNIIYAYLLHRGYKKTLEAFKRESGCILRSDNDLDESSPCKECSACAQQGDGSEILTPCTHSCVPAEEQSCSLYISAATIDNFVTTLDERHCILQMVSSGNTSDAIRMVQERFPHIDSSSFVYCRLLCQHFIELVLQHQAEYALTWFRETFDQNNLSNPRYKNLLEDTMGILCYKDLNCPAVASTYGKQRRLAVARDINDLILGDDGDKNCLKVLAQFQILGHLLVRKKNGHTGPKYSLSDICQPRSKYR